MKTMFGFMKCSFPLKKTVIERNNTIKQHYVK